VRDVQIEQQGKAIAEAIKATRVSAGLSKNALAQKAGIAIQSISFIENFVNSPSISTFLRICAALEVQPDVLMKRAITGEDTK
jgi:transcriptional regulator with XRE-family HTH domain